MSFRHAVGIALVGWYLMVPPPTNPSVAPSAVDVTAPFSKWSRWVPKAYASKSDCEKTRMSECENWLTQNVDIHWPVQSILGGAAQVCASVCVSTDDPRLKRK